VELILSVLFTHSDLMKCLSSVVNPVVATTLYIVVRKENLTNGQIIFRCWNHHFLRYVGCNFRSNSL